MANEKKSAGPVFVRAKEPAFYAGFRVRTGQVIQLGAGEPVPGWGVAVPPPPAAPETPPPPLATMSDLTHGRAAARVPSELPPTTREATEISAAKATSPSAGDLLQ